MSKAALIRRSLGLSLLLAAHAPSAFAQDATKQNRVIVAPPPAAPNQPVIIQAAPIAPTAPDRAAPTATNEALSLATNPPQVQSFALTPRPDGRSARLTVEFLRDARLPQELVLQLDDSRHALRATGDNTFTADIPFDTETFLKEQAVRAELARRGALVPVFEGRHFKGLQKVEFINQAQFRDAVRLNLAFRIPIGVFNGIPAIVDPARELMITDLGVVEDKNRTFDVCTGAGTKNGAWTFGKLATDMANGLIDPAVMVEGWLKFWLADQTINSFTVPERAAGMQNLLLSKWKRLPDGRLDLSAAPMRLLAIVNRLDLRGNAVYGGNAGEARFVFGVLDTANCQSLPRFTVILEYGVPKSGCVAVHDWAKQWHNLSNFSLGSAAYNDALQKITDQFAGPNAAPKKPNGSALNQLRTNEIALGSPWELREFHLDAVSHGFIVAPVVQTPDLSFDLTQTLKSYIDLNQAAILAHMHQVLPNFQNAPFLGGNAPNSFMFWNSSPAANSNDARHFFSQSTCNGCHGRETNTVFTHVDTRQAGSPSGLSQFLIGLGTLATPTTHQVIDPVVSATVWNDGDLLRRQQDLAALLGSSCPAGGILPAIAFKPLAAPH